MIENIYANTISQGQTNDLRQEKLKKACADFESLFLNYMLKSMRSSVPQDGITNKSEESKMFTSMFDENMANEIASSGGLGLGDILWRQLSARSE
jgi:flagellar protein FlgJ